MTQVETTGRYKRWTRYTWRDWWSVLKRTGIGVGEHNLSLMAAGVAFFAMLALFPAIAALISLYGFVSDPIVIAQNLELIEPLVPEDVMTILRNQVISLVTAKQALGFASVLSIGLAVWSARAGLTAMITGLNVVYRQTDRRNFLWSLVVAYGLTLLLIVEVIVAVAVVVVLPAVMAFVPLGGLAQLGLNLGRWFIGLLTVLVGIGALYRFAPNRRRARIPWITPGAVAAALLWVGMSMAFSEYLANFGRYNEVYGSLGAVVALLMWFYLSAFVVLLGAELNAEIEHHTSMDTTVGRPRPMGNRGAYVADHLAE